MYLTFLQIDEKNLETKSLALACKRFSGTHSFDQIAQNLNDIHESYNLSENKIVGTVTDNASNFCKAFNEFGITNSSLDVLESGGIRILK